MGTKNNPGRFDCYSRAEPDEPVFVLLGRDPVASSVVSYWVTLREELGGTEPEVLAEAVMCAVEMHRWARAKGKGHQLAKAIEYAKGGPQAMREFERLLEHAQKLEGLCRRATEAIEQCVRENDSDGGMRRRDEMAELAKELRGA
jgi:hypothetical protein